MVGRCLVNAFTEINTFIIENNKWEELHNDLFSAERGQLIEYQNRIENTDMKNKGEVMQLIKKFMQNFLRGEQNKKVIMNNNIKCVGVVAPSFL